MRISAAVVLTVFCALICLQLGCTGGWLSHCGGQDGHEGHDSHSDLCAQDLCGDDYPLPGKMKAPNLNIGGLAPLAQICTLSSAFPSEGTTSHPQIVVPSCSSPSGSFPLLI